VEDLKKKSRFAAAQARGLAAGAAIQLRDNISFEQPVNGHAWRLKSSKSPNAAVSVDLHPVKAII
jgi:hypothetical protein